MAVAGRRQGQRAALRQPLLGRRSSRAPAPTLPASSTQASLGILFQFEIRDGNPRVNFFKYQLHCEFVRRPLPSTASASCIRTASAAA
jgi:hypothetical protein